MKKTMTGVSGLDAITEGGVPAGRITLVTGDAGSGKTILALQTLVEGARQFAEPGVFVSFEEHADEIAANVQAFGWHVAPWSAAAAAPADAVVALDAAPALDAVYIGEFDLSGLLAALTAAVDRMAAKRVVFDGLDVVLDLLDDPRQRRREIVRIAEWTRQQGVTCIITAKDIESGPAQDRFEFLKYVVSGVILLRRKPSGGGMERSVRVLKLRGSPHSGAEHPLTIAGDGIVIGDVGLRRLTYGASKEYVSSGVERLDAMLGGGYYRGSSVLISGAPGTAKSTLAGSFIDAACRRRERALLISFDEAFSQIERNLASVGIHLKTHVESGFLAAAGHRTGRLSAEEHFNQIMALVEAHDPSALVIDPISALDKVVGQELAGDLAERLIDEAKARGITVLMTSLLDSANAHQESTRAQISSIADTWIQVSFAMLGGERNRALTIIKSRGNAHSNQVRELILSDEGIALADIYAQGGAILMGTARMEKEQADHVEEERRSLAAERAQHEVEAAQARVRDQLRTLQAELETLERKRDSIHAAEAVRRTRRATEQKGLLLRRHTDLPEAAEEHR